MPRSRNPANYEGHFWDISDACLGGQEQLRFSLSPRECINLRQELYSFIKALETQAAALKKDGNITAAAECIQAANAIRGYSIQIHFDGEPTSNPSKPPLLLSKSEVVLINRNKTPKSLSITKQLKAQAKNVPKHVELSENAPPPEAPVPNKYTDGKFDVPNPNKPGERMSWEDFRAGKAGPIKDDKLPEVDDDSVGDPFGGELLAKGTPDEEPDEDNLHNGQADRESDDGSGTL